MRAQVIRGHGGIDDIAFEPDWPDPVPGPDDVVLKVRACALNYHDLFTLRGMPGIKLNMPLIMGIDVAGDVAHGFEQHPLGCEARKQELADVEATAIEPAAADEERIGAGAAGQAGRFEVEKQETARCQRGREE